jgi:hypothetical protein
MGVIGTAILVCGFWSLAAVGLFLASSGLGTFRGWDSGIPLIPVAAAVRGWRRLAAITLDLTLLLAGCMLVVTGIGGVATAVL